MIVVRILAVLVGTALTSSVLISALETVVLPRSNSTRITRFVFAVADRILVHRWSKKKDWATNLRALYGPVALVSLPLVWMLSVTLGFSFIFWGIGHDTAQRSFEISGSSLFTLGFAEPEGVAKVWLTFVEATIGLGLVALLISYLPTIYAAHTQREKGVNLLRPFAGTPPSPVAMLVNMQRSGSLDNLDLWRTMMSWMIDLEQTHTAFPALCYFPQSAPEQSWVASVGSMVDGAALLLSASHFTVDQSDPDEVRGAMLALAYGMPGLARVGRAAGLPVGPPVLVSELMSGWTGPSPEISISRAEYVGALGRLTSVLVVPDGEVESCWQRFAWLRSGYDQAVRGLAGLTWAEPAEWTTDRPAGVGRPRLLLRRPVPVDWTVPAVSPPR